MSVSPPNASRASRTAALQSLVALAAAVAILLVLAVVTGGVVVPSAVALAAFALPSLLSLRSSEKAKTAAAPEAAGSGSGAADARGTAERPARVPVAKPDSEPTPVADDPPPVPAPLEEPVAGVATASGAAGEEPRSASAVLDASEAGQIADRAVSWGADAGHLDAPTVARGGTGHMEQRTIMLVDDEDALRRFCARILERAGFQVLQAQTGAEALALVRTGGADVDLLLTDVVMPEMSGPELAEHLLEAQHGMKVIYVSGYAEDTIQRHGIDPEADGMAFLPKPFKSAELLDAVNGIFRG